MQTMYKSELARLAGVSANTFRRYLNSRRDVLTSMGVTPKAQTLPPKAVKFIIEDYCIEFPEKCKNFSSDLSDVHQCPPTPLANVVPLHCDSNTARLESRHSVPSESTSHGKSADFTAEVRGLSTDPL